MHSSERNGPVSLGCGTLIIIAIIVLIFSGGERIDELKAEVAGLREEVRALQATVDELAGELRGQTGEAVPAEAMPAEALPDAVQ